MKKRVLFSGFVLLVMACSIGMFRYVVSERNAGLDSDELEPGRRAEITPDLRSVNTTTTSKSRPIGFDKVIDPDRAEEEISRLLADDTVSKMHAARELLSIAADARVHANVRLNALSHGLTLTSDEDFADVVLADVEQNKFESPEMHRLLLDDAYDREDSAKLTAALALVKNAQGDLRSEAIQLLAFVTRHDDEESQTYETWRAIVTEYLRKGESDQE